MGDADDVTPPGPCKELLSRVPSGASALIAAHFYPGAYHAFDHPNPMSKSHPTAIGSNAEARTAAIVRVKQFLASNLK